MGMSDWSWKQAVAEKVLEIVNGKISSQFSLEEVYTYALDFSAQFPRNKHVHEKIRQVLQRLRDENFLLFQGKGNYALNLEYEEITGEAPSFAEKGLESPKTRRVMRNVRLRNTFLGAEIKRRYAQLCQVCRKRIPLVGKDYCEAHHLKPLGSPHFGPDVIGNIVIVCPNHHVMFDYGALTIIPNQLTIRHHLPDFFPNNPKLHVQPWHFLNPSYLLYHHKKIFEKSPVA